MRVGIVGAGQVAQRHAQAYDAHPHTTVAAVAEPLRDRGEALATACGARWFATLDELLSAAGVDALSICVPHDLHRAAVDAACDARVHVLLEKPIANTLEDADAILDLTAAAGIVLMLGFVHRFRTEVLYAKQVVDSGQIGEPFSCLDRFCSLGGPHPPSWVWDRAAAGGGVLMYGGIHAVDRLRWLTGREVLAVTARAHRAYGFGDVEDGLVAMLDLEGDVTAVLFENSPPFGRPGGWATEIFGTKGAIRIQTGEWVEVTTAAGTTTIDAEDERHFEREIAEFVSAIADGREPSVPGRAGRDALAVALAAYSAAESGATVSVASSLGSEEDPDID
jgi:predicted dehydrogenase